MGFGAAADVATQIATEKSINPRRQSAESGRVEETNLALAADAAAAEALLFHIEDGQLLEDVDLGAAGVTAVPHTLGSVPTGAIILALDIGTAWVRGADSAEVSVEHSDNDAIVTLWVV